MCKGFGIIIDKELNLWFSEPDTDENCSHSLIIERLNWQENKDPHLRSFVRVEFADWMPESFEFDETTTLPGWCESSREEIQNKCTALLEKCAPARAEYAKVCAQAWAEYKKVCDPARAEYAKVCAQAWAEYEKVCDPAYAEYEKVRDQDYAEYEKVRAQAWAEYKKVCDQARAEYAKVFAQAYANMIASLKLISGYVGGE